MITTTQALSFKGRVWTVGDNIDTDMILPGRFLYATDRQALRQALFEGLDPSLAARIRDGDIFVAGRNFGCGSARPAPAAMRAAGICCVVAQSFSRTFLRGAIDSGVPILECDIHGRVADGDVIDVDVAAATVSLADGSVQSGVPYPGFVLDILRIGGILPYTRQQLAVHSG
jgi:3-isopropylmalate dehydratase small subunit